MVKRQNTETRQYFYRTHNQVVTHTYSLILVVSDGTVSDTTRVICELYRPRSAVGVATRIRADPMLEFRWRQGIFVSSKSSEPAQRTTQIPFSADLGSSSGVKQPERDDSLLLCRAKVKE
jgi:hypothetical protein